MGAYKGKKREMSESFHQRCPSNCSVMGKHSHSTTDLPKDTGSGASTPRPGGSSANLASGALEHSATFSQTATPSHGEGFDDTHTHDLKEAIRQSVLESSTGDTEEDRAIARAIQASIAELHRSTSASTHHPDVPEDEETQLRLALQESMIHDNMSRSSNSKDPDVLHIAGSHNDSDEDGETTPPVPPRSPRRAIPGDDDDDLQKAIEESRKHEEEQDKAKREEEIVLEYIKKQSLAEEEHRRRILQGRETEGEGSGAK